MSIVVVDTDVVSFAFKGDTRYRPFMPILSNKTLIVSFMTVAELRYWGRNRNWGKTRTEQLLGYLRTKFATYPATDELCEIWSELKADARKQGRNLDTADAWIAATAKLLNAPLVTHNAKDYEFLSGITVETF